MSKAKFKHSGRNSIKEFSFPCLFSPFPPLFSRTFDWKWLVVKARPFPNPVALECACLCEEWILPEELN